MTRHWSTRVARPAPARFEAVRLGWPRRPSDRGCYSHCHCTQLCDHPMLWAVGIWSVLAAPDRRPDETVYRCSRLIAIMPHNAINKARNPSTSPYQFLHPEQQQGHCCWLALQAKWRGVMPIDIFQAAYAAAINRNPHWHTMTPQRQTQSIYDEMRRLDAGLAQSGLTFVQPPPRAEPSPAN